MKPSSLPAVIVPVHNALLEVESCLESLHRTLPPGTEVLLLDDASDDHRIQPLLQSWLGRAGPAWRLERQMQNLGFVGTVNRGMELTEGAVVLLNSDTVLTPGWLEGLGRCLASDPDIATATPWTNNGEITSIPRMCVVNPVPRDPAAVARVIATSGPAGYPEVPTAVGFCMAISRAAIDTLGQFDEQLFGLGYGEENDFSMRASAAGLRNVLCDDVYVVHLGGRSFGPRGLHADAESMDKLLSRHPQYLELVQQFIATDPLAERRQRLLTALYEAGIELG